MSPCSQWTALLTSYGNVQNWNLKLTASASKRSSDCIEATAGTFLMNRRPINQVRKGQEQLQKCLSLPVRDSVMNVQWNHPLPIPTVDRGCCSHCYLERNKSINEIATIEMRKDDGFTQCFLIITSREWIGWCRAAASLLPELINYSAVAVVRYSLILKKKEENNM